MSGLSKLGLVSALAQGTTDYKALVCIFMFGGNDSNNMLVPTDSRYTQYLQARSVLALPQSQLLPLQMNGQSIYGLHPDMPEMQGYFNNQKSLAIVANVGTLVQPTTQATYRAFKNLPENLFSHSDQQDQWQSAQLAGTPVSGWAGKVADNVQTFNAAAQFPPILSISGSPVFCTGITTRPFSMDPGQPPGLQGLQGFDTTAASQARYAATQQLLTFDSGLSMVQAANAVTGQAVKFAQVLSDALKNIAPLQTKFPATGLGQQLQQVAQVISARSALGVQRQIFFCAVGGFDTHADQLPQQVQLLSDVSKSMSAFYQATQELAVANQVTSFTLSEFSRTLEPSSNGGSDHAWGAHQLILGGAVKGN
ncbi:MAG TPA: DUF1501 domain-containing protein, partial [Candidatus Sulfotelmatobacter sp.]|nr:DUF1501 domain-containing protein [Candidatus Sulfotelmatobacter sp.]